MRYLTSALLLYFLWLPPGFGGELPTGDHAEAAIELLEIMDAERTMMGGATAMTDAMTQQNPMLMPYRDVILTWAESFMTWEVFGPKLVNLYTEAFSEDEIEALIAFYQTPTGQKSIDLMPELMSRGAMIGAEEAQKHQAELETMLRERAAELEAERGSGGPIE